MEIQYAKGGVLIELGEDDFFFSDLKIDSQQFGSIIQEEGVFGSASYDGILGLSYPALSDQTKPFFDRIIELKILPFNLFSIYLSRVHGQNDSKLFLGGYSEKFYEGEIVFHKVIRKTWWTLRLSKVLINQVDSGLCSEETECEIIMDTGASLMATPPSMYESFVEKVTKEGQCSDYKSFPEITFVIDDTPYSLEPFEYVLSEDSDINYTRKFDEKGFCSVGFSIFDVGELNVWIAGDIFLTKYYSIYDRDHDRVGLALAKHN